eukprot:692667-Hanusia_phi.AAC.1
MPHGLSCTAAKAKRRSAAIGPGPIGSGLSMFTRFLVQDLNKPLDSKQGSHTDAIKLFQRD